MGSTLELRGPVCLSFQDPEPSLSVLSLGEEEISFPPTYRYERGSRDTYAWHKQKPTGVSRNTVCPRGPAVRTQLVGSLRVTLGVGSSKEGGGCWYPVSRAQTVRHTTDKCHHTAPPNVTQVRTNVPSWCDRILWKSYPETHIICNSYGQSLSGWVMGGCWMGQGSAGGSRE